MGLTFYCYGGIIENRSKFRSLTGLNKTPKRGNSHDSIFPINQRFGRRIGYVFHPHVVDSQNQQPSPVETNAGSQRVPEISERNKLRPFITKVSINLAGGH